MILPSYAETVTGDAAQLELRLTPDKTTFVLDESVLFQYSISNPTEHLIESEALPVEAIVWKITGPDGKVRKQTGRGLTSCVVNPDTVLHEPMSARHYTATLVAGKFPVRGRYRVQGKLYVGGDQYTYLESNELMLDVRQPSGRDLAAIQFFPSEDVFQQIARHGTLLYCKDKSGPQCFEELRQFLELHQESAYAPQIMWFLAAGVGRGELGVEPHSEIAEGLYRTFLDKWPNHPNAHRVLYGLALMLDNAGRFAEAVETIAEFASRFPEKTEMIRDLHENLRAGRVFEGAMSHQPLRD